MTDDRRAMMGCVQVALIDKRARGEGGGRGNGCRRPREPFWVVPCDLWMHSWRKNRHKQRWSVQWRLGVNGVRRRVRPRDLGESAGGAQDTRASVEGERRCEGRESR